ncbi:NUDIX domain-containing protein [Candidatus Woesearchaeota archaeon]|nr:NUDIX domain-containing protein [Candidatus Woesearchaeota archaeon]
MHKLKALLDEAVKTIGKSRGRLPRAAYDFIRRYEALLSIDSVIVPKGSKPSVLLLKREEKTVAGGKYYSVGGRLGKNKKLTEALRRIIKAETGLKVSAKKEDIIGFGTVWYNANKREGHEFSVFTPCLTFAVRAPEESRLRKTLKIGHGNTEWKIFRRIEASWDSYLTQAVASAWDYYYGNGWRSKLPAATKKRLKKYNDFIPLQYQRK